MKRRIDKTIEASFDVVIIGAGIYGATLAWSCSRVGLKVCLLDKNDFGSAASANSQKLIHGGLRYLKDLDLIRTIQSKNERKRLMKIAPHLVEPRKCFLPFYNKGLNRKSVLWAGLKVFDLLSYDRNFDLDSAKKIGLSKIYNKQKTKDLFPFVSEKGLGGSAVWFDSFCLNTERLVLSYIKTAVRKKTIALNYVQANSYSIKNNRIDSVNVKDLISENEFEIRTRFVINTTGYNSQNISGKQSNEKEEWLGGLNLLVPRLYENKNTIGLQSVGDDSRMYVATPWKDKTIIGTEWFNINSPNFKVTEKMCSQFLNKFNKTFIGPEINLEDVYHIYSGVIPAKNGEALKKEIIHDRLYHNISNLINVIGVKYTTAADVAERVVKSLANEFNFSWISRDRKPLVGGEIENLMEYKKFVQTSWEGIFTNEQINEIVEDYGTDANSILERAESIKITGTNGLESILIARVLTAIENEQAVRLSDILFRRTSIGISLTKDNEIILKIATIMKNKLKWSEKRFNEELDDIQSYFPSFNRENELVN